MSDYLDTVGDGAGPGLDHDEPALTITAEPLSGRRMEVQARLGVVLVHADTFDPHDASARGKFARAVCRKIDLRVAPGAVTPETVDEKVMAEIARLTDEAGAEAARAGEAPTAPATAVFEAVDDDATPVEQHGMYRTVRDDNPPVRLSNFTVRLARDVVVVDDFTRERRFEGAVKVDGGSHPFAIAAADYGDVRKFQAAVFAAAGARTQFLGDLTAIRNAVSAVSHPEPVSTTTAHGWDAGGAAYLTPTGVVDRDGFRPYRHGETRVDLGADGPQRGLGLGRLEPDRLREVKRHIVEDDLLRLHERPVTYTVLGVVALAALERFAGGTQRLGVWLVGLTGAGKSFLAKLAANFFGAFPVEDGTRFACWASTANYVERTGYWFRDALYVADDYKPEVVAASQVVRVLQVYADGAGRGRLFADGRANVTRPVRGLLVCTGEDLPEHNASALARMVIVPVPNRAKDLARAGRCLEFRGDYRGVTADFIAWLIREGRLAGLAERVGAYRSRFYHQIAGEQNDARIANNFALLAAAFEEFALYMGDDWPGREAEARAYVEEDLPAIRDRMLGLARGQQASEIFLHTLRDLVSHRLVEFMRDPQPQSEPGRKVIGKNPPGEPYFLVSIALVLAAVQDQLRREGREPLRVTQQALIDQLRSDGVILTPEGAAGTSSRQVRFGTERSRCVRIAREVFGPDTRP